MIYGPSGCGKTSLVKAGLLPRWPRRSIPVYIEATAEETEARLLQGLRKQCPGLAGRPWTWPVTLTALRQGRGFAENQKIVIVLDQFEQWLHANEGAGNGSRSRPCGSAMANTCSASSWSGTISGSL